MNKSTHRKLLIVMLTIALALCSLCAVACYKTSLVSISAKYNGGPVEIGASINLSDVVITATYGDHSTKTVTDFTLGYDFSVAGAREVTVEYTEGDQRRLTSFTVEVVAKSVEPEPTPQPTVTLERIEAAYNGTAVKVGWALNNADISVTAYYSNDTSKSVTNFSVGNFSSAAAGVQSVEISYSEGGITKSHTITVTVIENVAEVADYGKYGILQENRSVKITNTAIVNDELEIHFLAFENNSPGDCIYVKAGDNDILIDAGSTQKSADTIAKYLENYVKDGKLEYVIATHSDTDHIYAFVGSSSAKGILDRYDCDNIIIYPGYYYKKYMGEKTQTQATFEEKCQAKAEQGANLYTALECYNNSNGASRVYKLTDNVEMEFLYNYYYDHSTSNNNNFSVCLMFNQYGEGYDFDNPNNPNNKNFVNHYLFTGDLEGEGETYLVQYNNLPEVVLFKGGHHGSATSSNIVLLDKIQPKLVCVCTCCGDGKYGFPKQEFIDRTAKYTDMVFMTNQNVSGRSYTHLNGNITVTSNESGVFVNCSDNNTLFKDTDWFKNNRICPDEWSDSSEEPSQAN